MDVDGEIIRAKKKVDTTKKILTGVRAFFLVSGISITPVMTWATNLSETDPGAKTAVDVFFVTLVVVFVFFLWTAMFFGRRLDERTWELDAAMCRGKSFRIAAGDLIEHFPEGDAVYGDDYRVSVVDRDTGEVVVTFGSPRDVCLGGVVFLIPELSADGLYYFATSRHLNALAFGIEYAAAEAPEFFVFSTATGTTSPVSVKSVKKRLIAHGGGSDAFYAATGYLAVVTGRAEERARELEKGRAKFRAKLMSQPPSFGLILNVSSGKTSSIRVIGARAAPTKGSQSSTVDALKKVTETIHDYMEVQDAMSDAVDSFKEGDVS